jgi:hypothetical protein
MAMDIEALSADETLDGFLAIIIHGDSDDGKALVAKFLLKMDEAGNLVNATGAPSGPEGDEHNLPLIRGQIRPIPGKGGQDSVRKRLVDSCYASVFVARICNPGNIRPKVTKSDSQAGCRDGEEEQEFFHSLRDATKVPYR